MNPKNQNDEEHLVSDRLLKNFIGQTPVPIQIHSMDGMLIDFNSAHTDLFALSDAVVKELINTYNVLEDKQAEKLGLMPYVEKTFNGEIVSFPEYEYDPTDTLGDLNVKRDTNRKRWIKTKGFSIKDEKGVVTQIVFISEDFTMQKEAI